MGLDGPAGSRAGVGVPGPRGGARQSRGGRLEGSTGSRVGVGVLGPRGLEVWVFRV